MAGITEVTPSAGLNSEKMGSVTRSISPSFKQNSVLRVLICELKFLWRYRTPLGRPVEPEVKTTAARSSSLVDEKSKVESTLVDCNFEDCGKF